MCAGQKILHHGPSSHAPHAHFVRAFAFVPWAISWRPRLPYAARWCPRPASTVQGRPRWNSELGLLRPSQHSPSAVRLQAPQPRHRLQHGRSEASVPQSEAGGERHRRRWWCMRGLRLLAPRAPARCTAVMN
jgi:hypothetical protein